MPVRIPSEADERVRDVVRCRETFQREILKSRHYILKFLATRGFVFREGTNWCTPHLKWLQHLTTEASPLALEDRLIYREYHALLMYKLQRREELDRQIEQLAELPTLKPMVQTLQCFRGILCLDPQLRERVADHGAVLVGHDGVVGRPRAGCGDGPGSSDRRPRSLGRGIRARPCRHPGDRRPHAAALGPTARGGPGGAVPAHR